MFSMENFGNWLLQQLDARGINQSELSRLTGLNRGTISNIINGKKGLGHESIIAIAAALRLPPETVFTAAGLFKRYTKSDPLTEEITYIASQLPPEDVQELIELARLKLTRHERTQNAAKRA